MIEFFIVALFIGILVLVLEPFITSRKLPNKFITIQQIRKAELAIKRDELKESLRELELDHNTGKVSDADFTRMQAEYEKKLSNITLEFSAGGKIDSKDNIKKQIENEVKLLRKTKKELKATEQPASCPKCSTDNLPGSKFCSNCGEKLA